MIDTSAISQILFTIQEMYTLLLNNHMTHYILYKQDFFSQNAVLCGISSKLLPRSIISVTITLCFFTDRYGISYPKISEQYFLSSFTSSSEIVSQFFNKY